MTLTVKRNDTLPYLRNSGSHPPRAIDIAH